jgi:negative regulator of flagellin synthesis FlgM
MKVDLNGLTGPALDSINSPQRTPSETAATSDVSTGPVVAEDAATLSIDSARVNSLVAKALDSPQVREQKVEALRQAVQNGEYKVDPAQIAEAMIRQSE